MRRPQPDRQVRPDGRAPVESGAVSQELRVVGLDLSLTATGVAVAHRGRVHTVTIASRGNRADDWPARIDRATGILHKLVDWWRGADLVVIEGPSYRSNDPGAFDRAGLWWLVYRALWASERPVAVMSPAARARYATGKGNADKFTVHDAAVRRFPDAQLANADETDALWLAAAGLDALGQPLVAMPAGNREALAKVTWPLEVAP